MTRCPHSMESVVPRHRPMGKQATARKGIANRDSSQPAIVAADCHQMAVTFATETTFSAAPFRASTPSAPRCGVREFFQPTTITRPQ